MKTFTDFVVSGQFTTVVTAKNFIDYGGVIINGLSLFLTTATHRDHGCFLLLHGGLDQQSPLRSFLVYSSFLCQFNLVRRFAKVLITQVQLLAVCESFHP